MTQLFALHSAYGLATAAAALDEGLLGEHGERILVPFVSSRVPETSVGILADPALASLRDRFDRVEDLSALLGPLHPSSWKPDAADLPLLRRLFTRAWGLDGDDLEVLVQSPQVAPARTLMMLFPHARLTIIGDGLMTYSPMRVRLPHTVTARIGRVVHAEVVPGVTPLVGSPTATPVPVSPALFRAVLAETAAGVDDAADLVSAFDGQSTVLVLGQYLSALGLVSESEEVTLQTRMIDRAADLMPAHIVFKPHPAAPPRLSDALRDRAAVHGVVFHEYRGALAAEMLAERIDARAVIAGFSTALPTVQAVFGTEIEAVGADTVLSRLTPYENSNRVPATIVDALTRRDSPYRQPERMQLLIDAVGYAMQPVVAGHLRGRAEALLTSIHPSDRDRYFAPDRLSELRLPGAPPETAVRRALRPAGGIGRVEQLRLTALGARRRIGRAWRALRGR
ncbi:polysialyltransferase family glycosyltransferase [Microbacterium sp. WCS2018Hpa-23]|uniref:polysialyltransferase family glycosyltransferase n=1 Tax=Microbacterium sp. WCS2018Hpa-23 TaxID=3073634 RepID=UPI0028830889|nr:polysialyltransferase family glycosyltransferase [Microbacterium sp. WCS2018Hpa-23]